MRASGQGQPCGDFDGAFTDDYKYADQSGDVDKCNCMMWNGSYEYYVNNAYPWVLTCYNGTPDDSFNKSRQATSPALVKFIRSEIRAV